MSAIVVLGSINQDLAIKVTRPPLPGETIMGQDLSSSPGGKGANQAVAAARLGAEVVFVGAVGQDSGGKAMLDNLDSAGVDTFLVAQVPAPTATAIISVYEGGENSIVVIPGANYEVEVDSARAAAKTAGVAAVIAQLEILPEVVFAGLQAGKKAGALTILNAAPAAEIAWMLEAVDILVVNETEIALITGKDLPDLPAIRSAAIALAADTETSVIVTLGSQGCLAVTSQEILEVPAENVEVVDATGAGDTFCGALATFLVEGLPLGEALRLANRAAGLACRGAGAQSAMPTREML